MRFQIFFGQLRASIGPGKPLFQLHVGLSIYIFIDKQYNKEEKQLPYIGWIR